MKPSIFVTQPIEASALEKLSQHVRVEVYPDAVKTITKGALLQGVAGKDYLFCRLGDQIDADVITANARLKMIATMSSSPEGIDVATATKLKIPVIGRGGANPHRTQSAITEEAADLTWALLMAVARRILEGDRLVRSGVFPGPHSPYLLGARVNGKILGIVGMGKIGRAIAKRASAFDMNIRYYSTRRHADIEEKFNAAFVSFVDLLRSADFICVLPAYTAATHHLIGEKELMLMKPTAFLINTSRGPVVDQEALVKARGINNHLWRNRRRSILLP